MIEKLELPFVRTANTRTTNGIVERRVFEAAKLFIKDRTAMVDVVELTDDLPPLIGVVPLEVMEYVVYPDKLDVIPNPAHGGAYMLDLL